MELIKLIQEDNIIVPLRSSTKADVIGEIVDFLVFSGGIEPGLRDNCHAALMEREASMSTGMEHGVALPHATVDFLDELVSAFGVHPTGVPFDSADELDASLIMLMLVPKHTFSNHVRALAGISRLLSEDRLREHLKKAQSPREVLSIIKMHTGQ